MMIKNKVPVLSIICVVLNNVVGVKRMLESIIPQLSEAIELIVIDGGSTDGTLDTLNRFSDFLTYWVSEPDKGIYDAWNKGLAKSNGQFVAFIGSDDVLEKDYVSRCLSFLMKNQNLDYVSFKIKLENASQRVIGEKWVWRTFRRHMKVAHVGSLHNRDLYARYGLYDISYKIAGDYEFLLRPKSSLRVEFIDYVGLTMGTSGVSNRYIIRAVIESMRAKLSNNSCNLFVATIDCFVAIVINMLRHIFSNK